MMGLDPRCTPASISTARPATEPRQRRRHRIVGRLAASAQGVARAGRICTAKPASGSDAIDPQSFSGQCEVPDHARAPQAQRCVDSPTRGHSHPSFIAGTEGSLCELPHTSSAKSRAASLSGPHADVENRMNDNPPEKCIFCHRGQLADHTENIAFYQYTDRGYVHCVVVIPMKICDYCGTRNWDDRADAIMDDAVRQEYDKLK